MSIAHQVNSGTFIQWMCIYLKNRLQNSMQNMPSFFKCVCVWGCVYIQLYSKYMEKILVYTTKCK